MLEKQEKETAFQRLEKLIGMENLKREVEALKRQKEYADESHGFNLHYVITGNPGTGKTTAANLLGEILYEFGYLESGHTVQVTRKDLVAGYVGQTAIQTKGKIEEAMGGVLFIDEADSLVEGGENDFGLEAITELVAAMTEKYGQFSVIIAGYPDKMKTFIDFNPGFKRRFLKTIHIDDYEPEELMQIFYRNLQNNRIREKYIISNELTAILGSFFENWHKSRDKNWGNAREVENLLDKMDGNWHKRNGEKSAEGELILDICDIPKDKQQYCKPSQESKENAMNKLKKLIGLSRVKESIEKLKRRIHIEEATEPGHYVFAGNPGTGKTTVARLLGDILREEGVLKRGHVIEVLREGLIAGYVGQTAIKTKEKLQEALDGIFFLDEAYSLVQGDQNDFGQEAINTILAFIENNRARICAIFAGYTKNMEDFIQSNPGLTRRISETIIFDDYNTDEMVGILNNFAGDFVLEPEYIQKSRQIFDSWIENKTSNFGNAGQVRNYFAESKDALYERIYKEYESDIPEKVKKTLTGKDIPSKYLHIVGNLANE